jgi:hypothetical protein
VDGESNFEVNSIEPGDPWEDDGDDWEDIDEPLAFHRRQGQPSLANTLLISLLIPRPDSRFF